MPPLILTALLDDAAQHRFDELRRRHFPPERNHLDAHVTLFHQLPGGQQAAVAATLAVVARRAPIPVQVTGVRSLGRGVAFRLASDELSDLRSELAREWAPWLSPQDRAKSELHVTVQNKVPPAAARALHRQLAAGFVPHLVHAVGLGLWRYLDGPWERVGAWSFRSRPDSVPAASDRHRPGEPAR